MAQEKTSNFYPNTKFEQEDGAGWFPNTDDLPEEIEIPTQPISKGAERGRTSLHVGELPSFIADRLEGAFRTSHSHTCETLDWYIGTIHGGGFFDKAALKEMRNFRQELGDAQDYPERKEILGRITKYLRGMSVVQKKSM